MGTPSGEYTVTYQPALVAAAPLAAAIQVTPKSLGTGILSISMQTPNAMLGADVINMLMDEYADYTIEEKNKASDQIIAFIDGRSRLLGKELDSIQDVLLVYSQRNNIIDIEAQLGGYFSNISSLDKTINEQQFQLEVSDFVRSYLNDKKNQFNKVVVPSPLTLNDVTLATLVSGYNAAQMERAALLEGNVPPENPLVKEKETEIEKIRLSLMENLKNIGIKFIHIFCNRIR